jgi:predicted transposase YbfD/YdcC
LPKKTFECADLAQAILLTQVKENHKTLLKQLEHGCHIQRPLAFHDDGWEKAHGRLERRQYEVFSSRPMLDKWQNEWGSIEQVIRVTRFRQRLNSKQKETEEVHYYASNRSLSADISSQAIRRHWYIENKLHYVKDVAFQEDANIKRVNPFVFSTCIDFALNRLRKNGCKNIKNKIYEISLNIENLIKHNITTSNTSTP